MGFANCPPLRLTVGFLFVLILCAAAVAEASGDRTQFGHDITIGPNEAASDVTCFGCSVRVRGHVATDVTVFGGSVLVEGDGQVGGDATVFMGNVRLDRNVKVNGDVTVFGGRIHRDAGAAIGGDVTNFAGAIWILLILGLPLVMLGAFVALIVWLVRRLTRPRVPATAAM